MLAAAMRLMSAQAPLVMISGVVIGAALPGLAASLRPAVVPVAIVIVLLSILRIDPERLGRALRRPVHLVAVLVVVLLVVPVLVGLAAASMGAPGWLATGLALAAAAPPLSSAAAFAILLRIDAAEVTAISVPATLISPLTVWLITSHGPGLGVGVDASGLVLRLGVIIGLAFAVAFAIRRIAGERAMVRAAAGIDTGILLLIVVIGIGVMDDINIALRTDPVGWAGIFAGTWAVMLASCLVVGLAFWSRGRDLALAAAVAGGFRNMALMVAAVSDTVAPEVVLVVITAQLPLYFTPLLLRPAFARLGRG
jgi:predicted Na+-dependent transporter